MKRFVVVAVTAFALLAALLPAAAMARGTDRNHDRLPDKWERHHSLSLKVKQTKRDQDRDGLNNLREYKNHSNPRDADTDDDGLDDGDEVQTGDDPGDDDSDNDGIEDGDENAGKVVSFDSATGLLVIELAKDGSQVSGTVNGDTEIECEGSTVATASSEGDDDSGDDEGDDHGDDSRGENEQGDDHGDDGHCGTEALTENAVVKEAELSINGDGSATWHSVHIRS